MTKTAPHRVAAPFPVLAAAEPERVEDMLAALARWRASVGISSYVRP